MKRLTRIHRVTALENVTPRETSARARVELLRTLFEMDSTSWAVLDVRRIANQALEFCERFRTPEHDELHALICERLPVLDTITGPKSTDPRALEDMERLSYSSPHPHAAAAVVLAATGADRATD